MILVLCEDDDAAAFWAAGQLQARGLAVRLVTGAELAAAEIWRHRIGQAGVTLDVRFVGGDQLCLGDVRAVLNRLSFLPGAWLRRLGGPDREYAVQEMYAFCLSWLHALPGPQLNAPAPQGLGGNWRHPSAWMALAGRAGLPVSPYRLSCRDDPAMAWQPANRPGLATAVVAGERVVTPPALPPHLHAGCRRLAAAAGAKLLGVDFALDGNGMWRFAGASVLPNLVQGGEALADALAEALTQ